MARGDGSAARPLLQGDWQDYNASLSSDGSWVTFTSERSGSADLYRVRLDGTHLEPLVTGPSFDDQGVLSPDGGRLAFVSDRDGQADIWVKDLKNGALTNVTHHAGGDFRPAWSPDGRWLAFSSDRDSPRKKFAFVTLHSTAIYLTRVDGFEVRQLTPAGQFAGSPKWSADGKQIVFYECDLENVNNITSPRRLRGTTQIISIDIATSERRVWTEGKGEKWSPQWLAEGRLAFASGGSEGGVEFSPGAAGARGQIASPSWSTDGKWMVFHRDVGSGWPPLQ